MATKAQAKAATIGKAELAIALGWTRPRLDRRLDQDAKFPVKKRGTRAGGWQFDLEKVRAYLNAGSSVPAVPKKEPAAAPKAKPPAATPAPRPPADDEPPGAAHRGEGTASQRLKNAQAAREEDKLRKDRRELVEAEEMRVVLGTMLAHLGKGLDGLPDLIVRRLGLPEESGDVLREMTDDLRRAMVADLQPLLG